MNTAKPFDIEHPGHLEEYLRESGYLGARDSIQVKILNGGVSSRTVVTHFSDGRVWVVKQALEKLRVQAEWRCDPSRIHREAAGLRVLNKMAPCGSVVPFIFEDAERHLLGMEAVPEPHENFKTRLMSIGPEMPFVAEFGMLLGALQKRAASKRDVLVRDFSDRSFFESLRLEPYYAFSASQVPEAAPFLESLIVQNRAAAQGAEATLVHGDFSPKNVLIHEGRLILLDHEVIHWGDASFDPGFALTHFLSKAHYFPEKRAAFGEAARTFWDAYSQVRGASPALERRVVTQTLGCLLARVAGRSPLEYLDAAKRDAQKVAVLALMEKSPKTVGALVTQFLSALTP